MKFFEMMALGLGGLLLWFVRSLSPAENTFARAPKTAHAGGGKYYSYPVFSKKTVW